jgi:monofunctional biosynthetic peptidoglycan transglycosylase
MMNPGMARKKAKRSRRRRIRFLVWALCCIILVSAVTAVYLQLSLPEVSALKVKNPSSTSLMRMRIAQAAEVGKNFIIHQQWMAFEQIPGLLKAAVRVSEDASFYWHRGIDYTELKESLKRDLKEGRFSRGGSTITQQLAKNLYLSTRKSLWRKLKEYMIAKRLEKTLSKDRIFSLYLNLIEMGPGIFGIQSASGYWFEKDVRDLSLEEMVRLTAIIPRPLDADPRSNTPWMSFRIRWIADTLLAGRHITEHERQHLLSMLEDGEKEEAVDLSRRPPDG